MTNSRISASDTQIEKPRVHPDELLRDEFGQAWQHYRHLEILRGQYINYAFTITLGSIALAIPLVSQVSQSVTRLLLSLAFVMLYALIIGSQYANVRKVRFVLLHYQGVLMAIREYFYADRSDFRFDIQRLDLLSHNHPVISGRLFRTQTIAESTLVAFLLAAAVAAFTMTLALVHTGTRWWQMCLAATMSSVVWAVAAGVIIFWIRYRRDLHADQGPAHRHR